MDGWVKMDETSIMMGLLGVALGAGIGAKKGKKKGAAIGAAVGLAAALGTRALVDPAMAQQRKLTG